MPCGYTPLEWERLDREQRRNAMIAELAGQCMDLTEKVPALSGRVAALEAALREIITFADDVGMHSPGDAFREIVTICNKHLQK